MLAKIVYMYIYICTPSIIFSLISYTYIYVYKAASAMLVVFVYFCCVKEA